MCCLKIPLKFCILPTEENELFFETSLGRNLQMHEKDPREKEKLTLETHALMEDRKSVF